MYEIEAIKCDIFIELKKKKRKKKYKKVKLVIQLWQ